MYEIISDDARELRAEMDAIMAAVRGLPMAAPGSMDEYIIDIQRTALLDAYAKKGELLGIVLQDAWTAARDAGEDVYDGD